MDDGRDAYFFTAGMSDSPHEAGRTFKAVEIISQRFFNSRRGKSLVTTVL
jgi:hypothetical protein